MKKKTFNKYEDEIKDIGEFIGTDIEINPEYYIHNAILKAQQALNDENIEQGVFKFRFYAENIEILAKAADRIPKDYEAKITAFKATKDYTEEEGIVKHFRLANYKMQLLLGQVFSSKLTTVPMKA
jgi:hypothetical protein